MLGLVLEHHPDVPARGSLLGTRLVMSSPHPLSIAKVYDPRVARVIRPPWATGTRLDYQCLSVSSITSFPCPPLEQGAVRREPLAVALALDHDLVAGVGEPVEGAVAEDRVVEEAEPLLDGAVGGDDEAGAAVAADDQMTSS